MVTPGPISVTEADAVDMVQFSLKRRGLGVLHRHQHRLIIWML